MFSDPDLIPPPPEAPAPTEPEWQPGRERPPWNGWDVVVVALVALFAIVLSSFVALTIAMQGLGARRVPVSDLVRNPKIVVPAQLAAYVLVVAFMYFLVRMRAPVFLRTVRWNWPYRTAPGFWIAGMILALVVQVTSSLLPIPKSLPIEHYFRDPTGAWLMAAFGISVAPVVEELFFRGFLYPVLARRLGLFLAVVLTAAGFALLHAGQLAHAWAPLLMLFIVGVVLTLVRARTGSVAAGVLMHAGYNAMIFALLYFGTGHFRHFEKMG